jgi:hypothetical protein
MYKLYNVYIRYRERRYNKMSFFEYLVGGAFLLGTGYLKAKEGMSCDNDDYKEMNTQQKINALSSGLQTSLQKDIDNTKKNFKRQIKNKDDKYILNAINNMEKQGLENDYRYDILCQEAYERGL